MFLALNFILAKMQFGKSTLLMGTCIYDACRQTDICFANEVTSGCIVDHHHQALRNQSDDSLLEKPIIPMSGMTSQSEESILEIVLPEAPKCREIELKKEDDLQVTLNNFDVSLEYIHKKLSAMHDSFTTRVEESHQCSKVEVIEAESRMSSSVIGST